MILIITIGSKNFGYGHLNRSILLSLKLPEKTDIFNAVSQKIKKNTKFKNFSYVIKKINNNHYNKIICDFANINVLKNEKLKKITNILNKKKIKIIFFDDLKKYKFYLNFFQKNKLTLIRPYFDKCEKNVFSGPKYFICNKIFKNQIKKKINYKLKNVLITFGGSDPKSFTKKILKIILAEGLNKKIIFTIIIGPFFQKKYVKNLVKNFSFKNINFKQNINNISYFVNKSDLVLTLCGITKYEIALLRCPMIIFPLTLESFRKNKHFQREGMSYTIFKDFNSKKIKNIFKLLSIYKKRKKMYQMCKNKIDINGLQRVKKVIYENKNFK